MENWIKNNLVLLGVILAFILYFTYNEFLAKPDNYNECVIYKMNKAKNSEVARTIRTHVRSLCRAEFPQFDPNKPFQINPFLAPKGLTPFPPKK